MKHKLYLESSVYTLPSLYEPHGITLLEASIHGTPSIITGQGGQVETAPPGIASMWSEPRPEKYGDAIIEILTNEKLRKMLSLKAKEWAQRHLWNTILPRYLDLYKRLVE